MGIGIFVLVLLAFGFFPMAYIIHRLLTEVDRPNREACARALEKTLGGKTEAWKRIYGDLKEYKYPDPD